MKIAVIKKSKNREGQDQTHYKEGRSYCTVYCVMSSAMYLLFVFLQTNRIQNTSLVHMHVNTLLVRTMLYHAI